MADPKRHDDVPEGERPLRLGASSKVEPLLLAEPVVAAAAVAAAARPVRWNGEALRQAREARGLTVPQIAERTKITRHHIENVEAERRERLPAPVYLRGILLAMARELRLDGQKVARSYIEALADGDAGGEPRR